MIRPRVCTNFLIVHREEAPQAQTEYNWLIRRDGSQQEGVAGEDGIAAHALSFNPVSCGIAFEGDFARGDKALHNLPSLAQWRTGVVLLTRLCRKYELSHADIKGHTEMGVHGTAYPAKLCYSPDGSCPGLNFSLPNLRAAVGQSLQDIIKTEAQIKK